MGKYALLVVSAALLGFTVYAQQGARTAQDISEGQDERQGEVIARQIARSAFNDGISEVKRRFDTIGEERREGNLENGTFRLQFDPTTSGGAREVHVTATGTYRSSTYQIKGTAVRDTSVSALFNAITASKPVTFDVAGGGCSGEPCVSGVDVGGREDRAGISLPQDQDTGPVCEEFDDEVVGRGGVSAEHCDVQSRYDEHDDWVLSKLDRVESRILANKGNEDVVTCDNCRAQDFEQNGEANGGILYVTGEFRVNGSDQWHGLVFVSDGGSVRINGGGDTRNINGGLLLQENTAFVEDEEFDMNGGNAVQYNTNQLLKYLDILPSLKTETIEVTDRSGRLLQPGEEG
jgi:hypothetical protein